jgi:aminomethyltransferase
MVDFAGWEMPVQYSSIIEEHAAVRTAAGLFDISHMGRLRFTGSDACCFLDFLLTNDVTKLEVGQIRYSLIVNESGGILDDVLVYRFTDSYLLVVNASNRSKIVDWIETHGSGFQVEVDDQTTRTCMMALQGPRATDLIAGEFGKTCRTFKYYTGVETSWRDRPAILTRTGYTGEDGFEVILQADSGLTLWEEMIAAGSEHGLLPAGLGCRDTLRLEAAMPLYGHELDESTDPFTAGLAFGVKLNAGDFVGKPALIAAKSQTDRPVRVGLELTGRRIARDGAALLSNDAQAGRVTSGTFSPTLGKSIAMGYLDRTLAEAGTQVEVDVRGKRAAATVVALPFYSRS